MGNLPAVLIWTNIQGKPCVKVPSGHITPTTLCITLKQRWVEPELSLLTTSSRKSCSIRTYSHVYLGILWHQSSAIFQLQFSKIKAPLLMSLSLVYSASHLAHQTALIFLLLLNARVVRRSWSPTASVALPRFKTNFMCLYAWLKHMCAAAANTATVC